jgi:uroporphyrinogen decarboxylase
MVDPTMNAMRMMQIANGMKPDQVPVFLPIESGFMAEFGGASQKQYHHDPGIMLECQAKVSARFGGLTPLYTDFGVVTEAAAFCDIFWPEDDSPWAHPAMETAADVARLKVPDVERDGLFPQIIEYFETMNNLALKRGVRSLVPNPRGPVGFGSLRGPVVLAAMIRGINEFLMDLILAPKEMHALMEIATQTLLAYLDLQKNHLGGLSAIFMCDDVCGLLSPHLFEEFFIPYAKRIFDAHKDVITIFHCDSDMAKTVLMAPLTGAKAFHMGYMHDLAHLKAEIGGSMCLLGNVPPVHVMLRRPKAEVVEAARVCIAKAAPGGGFGLSCGGVIDRGTPPENIDALIEATELFGKY